MTKAIDSRLNDDWSDDEEMDTDTDMNDMDELEFEAFDDDEDEPDEEVAARRSGKSANEVPVWRLIEITRESRRLKDDLADFEDYEFFDRFDTHIGIDASR